MKPEHVHIGFVIPKKLADMIEEEATYHMRSRSAQVVWIVRDFLERKLKEKNSAAQG